MKRAFRLSGYIVLGLLIGLALVVGLLWILTRTEFGVEQAGRFAVARIAEQIQGELRVGRVTSRGLLGGAILHDVVIDDPKGRPFVRADSIRLGYNLRTLLGGRIVFDRITLFDPEVYLERLPGDTAWNYDYVFEDLTPEDGPDRLILFERARIVNGLVVIRAPWEPDEPVIEPEDTARLILEPVPGGIARVFRFEQVNADLPQVLWESPVEEGRLFRVASLSTHGYIWEEPFELRDLRATITLRDSILSFEAERFRLPDSRGSGIGRIVLGEDERRYDVRIEADDVAFEDLQWLYPPLPDEGRGSLVLRIQTQPQGTLWLATDARLRTPGTQLAGSFGIVVGDTLYFTRVSLRASPLDVDLLEEVLPVELPVEGLMVGTVEVEGPISSLTTRGELEFRGADATGASAVRWSGTVDLRRPFAAQNLRADVERLDLALISALRPDFRLSGAVSGRIEATGRLDNTLRFTGSVEHSVPGHPTSTVRADGVVRQVSGHPTLEAEVSAEPLVLDALAAAWRPLLGDAAAEAGFATDARAPAAVAPAIAWLKGEARGPIRVTGSQGDLNVRADLDTPAGPLVLQGRIDLSGAEPRLEAEGYAAGFRLDRVTDAVPTTTVTTRFSLEGEGADLVSARAGLRFDVERAQVGSLDVQGARVDVRIRDGLAEVDTFVVRTDAGRLTVQGNLGLVADRRGSLRVELDADSLLALRPFFFPDTLLVPGAAGAARRVAGSLRLAASIEGTIAAFDTDGTAVFERPVYDRFGAGAATLRFAARAVGTDSAAVEATFEADSLRLNGRWLPRAVARGGYRRGAGEVQVEADGPGDQRYRAAVDFERAGGAIDLLLRELDYRTGGIVWALAAPAVMRASRSGIAMDELRLDRNGGEGRLRMSGRLPWRPATAIAADGPADWTADYSIDFERVRIGEFLRMAQADTSAAGVLDGRIAVGGVADAPVITADLSIAEVRYGDVRLDRLDAVLRYEDRRLDARIEGVHGGEPVMVGEGRVPLELALTPVAERRLDRALRFELRADSLPAALPLSFLDSFQNVEGSLTGSIQLGGTTLDPALAGALTLGGGAATWRASGVRYRSVGGTFRLQDERTVAVELVARSDDGDAAIAGTVRFTSLADPMLDLTLRAREFQAAERRDVELTATGELRLTGSYARPRLAGGMRVDRGALYLDELWRRYQIVDLESPLLFDVVDTSLVAVRQIVPESESSFLRNLVIDGTTIEFGRDFWLRSRELNAEMAGELEVAFDRQAGDLRLSGTLNAIRGSYQLQLYRLPPRQFQIREGTVEFVGTPGIDPNLDITAVYRVRTLQREPLEVRAVVTGTLQAPRVQLTSDAEPPISESDLASYVIFGRPSFQLASEQNGVLGLDPVRQVGLGFAATGLEAFARDLVGLDYVAISPPGFELADATGDDPAGGWRLGDFLAGTEVEIGRYLPGSENLFLAFSYRITSGTDRRSTPGAHLEWRFGPTWTAELFAEDRFARNPSFGLRQIDGEPIFGLFLFREWGF